MLEAKCTRCKETFIPHGLEPADIIHEEQENGFPCGGVGDVLGEWVIETEPPQITYEHQQYLEEAATHGWNDPDCDAKRCKFHHPVEEAA